MEHAGQERIDVPANALVVLIGPSGAGKSTWARRWFSATQVVSSDRCRALVADDETDQAVNRQAFAVFYEIIRRRLELERLTVADSTALTAHSRARLHELAAAAGVPRIAVVMCATLRELIRQNESRPRRVARPILMRHAAELEELLRSGRLEREGYHGLHYLRAAPGPAPLVRAPLPLRSRRATGRTAAPGPAGAVS